MEYVLVYHFVLGHLGVLKDVEAHLSHVKFIVLSGLHRRGFPTFDPVGVVRRPGPEEADSKVLSDPGGVRQKSQLE